MPAAPLITAAARDALQPLGLRQRGRSRLWFDDRGWWLILVEFQPSSWNQGTYLNVGAMWLWPPRNVWTFDEGGRLRWQPDGAYFAATEPGRTGATEFLAFDGDEQFAQDLRLVADVARRRTLELREQLRDLPAVVDHLTRGSAVSGADPRWRALHRGVAAGLNGDEAMAGHHFSQVAAGDLDPPYVIALARQAAELRALAGDPPAFRARIEQDVEATRRNLKFR
ncbi:hypothetical protein ACQP00_35325 [Dactylosporangium sp. CS-047395]|uniref:hypothetical protein n=1 Tax=Dactylosporangium sp. CS-047395 TaxID=3239936 RepID=UPI003D8EE063